MDGDFPWVLAGVLLLWLFSALGGRKRPPGQRPELPRDPTTPRRVERRPEPARSGLDSTQAEGGRLDELLRALEQRLDPAAAEPARPRPRPAPRGRGPLGRPATVPLPAAEELEDRESLEVDRAVETLESEVRRPERVRLDRLAAAEAKEQARLAQIEARDREPHKSRHAGFDQRIRAQPVSKPAARRLTPAQIRQAFIWAEILGRPKSEG